MGRMAILMHLRDAIKSSAFWYSSIPRTLVICTSSVRGLQSERKQWSRTHQALSFQSTAFKVSDRTREAHRLGE